MEDDAQGRRTAVLDARSMPKVQTKAYHRGGFVFPTPLLNCEEAAASLPPLQKEMRGGSIGQDPSELLKKLEGLDAYPDLVVYHAF